MAKKSTVTTRRVNELSVGDIIRRLLPNGSVQTAGNPAWDRCPIWGADIFAVAASIVQASSCYADPHIALSINEADSRAKRSRAEVHEREGKRWRTSRTVPLLVRSHWKTLIDSFNLPISDGSQRPWKSAALALVAITDEAFAGAGFFPEDDDGIANFVWSEMITAREGRGETAQRLPRSLAVLVPTEAVCVLPKTLTPNVGCTLRSLTHHLALLPASTIVSPSWIINQQGRELSQRLKQSGKRKYTSLSEDAPNGVFNVLLVPFPYVMHATDFTVARGAPSLGEDGYYELNQDWLRDGTRRLSASQIAKFIGDLVQNAQEDCGSVHAVVLPELALSKHIAENVARTLAKRFDHLELFVTGMADAATRRNYAAQYRLSGGEVISEVLQSKHHRWRLEENQIRQYQLGGVLDPRHIWWENIDVHQRAIGFSANRHDAVISALVCEDLARYDPVLPTVAAVGPTLVIALLLDGPQLQKRWPGRYATVLAEDPGSSVLTLTNMGMIQRSSMPAAPNRAVIGLWKERQGAAVELELPANHHAILLALNCLKRQQVTLDRREDDSSNLEYRLGGARAVRLNNPPKWLERTTRNA